jgi:transposase-like protein
MHDPALFKWRHFQADIIVCAVRWYVRYVLSYRDVEELLRERGVWVDHTTVFRWVQRYAPELEQRCRPLLKATNDSYRVDETSIKIKKQWYYLYRAVDSEGLYCKNWLEGEERLASSRYAATPNSWLMTRFWARTSFLAIPSSWPLRSLCMA